MLYLFFDDIYTYISQLPPGRKITDSQGGGEFDAMM